MIYRNTNQSDLIANCLTAVAWGRKAGRVSFEKEGILYQSIGGGANNALYQIRDGSQLYALKLCIRDNRHRAEREFKALRMLQQTDADLAPQALALDVSCSILPNPAVLYRWLPGETLGGQLSQPQLTALLGSIQKMHSFQQQDYDLANLPDAWFHWFDYAAYLRTMKDFMEAYGSWLARNSAVGRTLQIRLKALLHQLQEAVAGCKIEPSRQLVPLSLCHVDFNLSNAVYGDDGKVRWVDWEYAGWGDPALEVAELRWHAAMEQFRDDQHAWLRDSYRPPQKDAAFWQRVAVWDQVISVHWPFLVLRWLYSLEHGPDRPRLIQPQVDPSQLWERLSFQVERAEKVFQEISDGDQPVTRF